MYLGFFLVIYRIGEQKRLLRQPFFVFLNLELIEFVMKNADNILHLSHLKGVLLPKG
tara:strand:- start:13615 stop:13785 length:171 start_codon:yes stop_codon:yes gene_type:complete